MPEEPPTGVVAHKRRKGRSPSYPAVDLRTAVGRARALWEVEALNSAPVDVVLGHWGYSPGSGAGNAVLAALKKFGLIEDEGSGEHRRAHLTALARDIILDPGSAEREERIREAALNPTIHQELWDRYRDGQLPSDDTLKYTLIRDRSFTQSGAADFVSEFRATLDFAGLVPGASRSATAEGSEPGSPSSSSQDSPDESINTIRYTQSQFAPSTAFRSVQLPLPGTEWATLQGPFPITEEAWAQLMAVLNAMKPALVRQLDEPRDAD